MEENKMIKQTRFGWVDLSCLPRTKNDKIDWKNSGGCIVPFLYQDVCSNIYIIRNISSSHVCITIPDYVSDYKIVKKQIIHGEFGGVLQKITSNFRYHAGDVVNKTLLILSSYMDGRYKAYNYQCLIDGYEGHITEGSLCNGRGCLVCSRRVVVRGINDIATTHPDVASLFWDENCAYKYSAFSKHKNVFRCPNCGNKISAAICNVTTQGLSCPQCGDGFSYPEKFVFSVLKQILKLCSNVEYVGDFETQKTFDWSKNILHNNPKLSGDKIYDFYLPIYGGLLIETHGQQHFEQCLYNTKSDSRTLMEEQENDRLKYDIAIHNDILPDHYVILDCRRSTVQHIKQSIMQSVLPRLLNFTEDQIDWYECGKIATSSRVFEVCELWNDGVKSTRKIATEMKIGQSTVRNYLRRGEELGIVQDPPKHIKRTNTIK